MTSTRVAAPRPQIHRFLLCLAWALLLVRPGFSAAQVCDPRQGHIFLFDADTRIGSLTIQRLQQVPGKTTVSGAGTLKLLDGTVLPLQVHGKPRGGSTAYAIKGNVTPWRARGVIRLRGCPGVIDRVRVVASVRKGAKHLLKDLAAVSLAGTPALHTTLLDETRSKAEKPDEEKITSPGLFLR